MVTGTLAVTAALALASTYRADTTATETPGIAPPGWTVSCEPSALARASPVTRGGPSTPRTPMTSNARRATAVAALAAGLAITATACRPADAHGTITRREHHGKWRFLTVREPSGHTVRFRVGVLSHEWRHCHLGKHYPECAH